MTTLYIDKRIVPVTPRNKRIYSSPTKVNTKTTSELVFSNGLKSNGTNVMWSGIYDGNKKDASGNFIPLDTALTLKGNTVLIGNEGDKVDPNDLTYGAERIENSLALTVVGNTKIYGELDVQGNIKASKDVICYFISEASTEIVDALTVSYPLVKTGTNLSLNYDASQFLIVSNKLSINPSILGSSAVSWNNITDKPSTFTPSTHTVASHSDYSMHFNASYKAKEAVNSEYALNSTYASIANSVEWTNVANKPTLSTVATSGSYADLLNKPTINDLSGTLATSKGGTGLTGIGSSLQVLRVNAGGTALEYATISTGGSVSSVGMSVPTGFNISGSPITSSGTLGLTFASGYSLPTTAKQTTWDDVATKVTGGALATNYLLKYSGTSITASAVIEKDSSISSSVPLFSNEVRSETFVLRNSSGTTLWKISFSGTDMILLNSNGDVKARLTQSGDFTVTGDVTAFG